MWYLMHTRGEISLGMLSKKICLIRKLAAFKRRFRGVVVRCVHQDDEKVFAKSRMRVPRLRIAGITNGMSAIRSVPAVEKKEAEELMKMAESMERSLTRSLPRQVLLQSGLASLTTSTWC